MRGVCRPSLQIAYQFGIVTELIAAVMWIGRSALNRALKLS